MTESEQIPQPKYPKVVVPKDNIVQPSRMRQLSITELPALGQGVEEISHTQSDAKQIADLEAKIYDNPKLLCGQTGFEVKFLQVKEYNDKYSKPTLSFVHKGADGVPDSYIFAFEGNLQPKNDPSIEDEGVVYIFDLASNSRGAGAIVLSEFLKRYKAIYEGNPYPPIFIKARETTSYPLIKPHSARMAKFLGINISMDEIALEPRNGDIMHHLIIKQDTNQP